jgi:hypothetical protein
MDGMVVEPDPRMVAAWAEYEKWLNIKQKKSRIGGITFLVSFPFVLALKQVMTEAPDAAGIFNDLLLVFSFLNIWAAIQILDSKGRSRWFWLIGIFIFLLADHNKRNAPQKPGSGIKPDGSAFSDW